MMPFEPDWAFIRRHTLLPALSMLGASLLLGFSLWTNAVHERLYEELSADRAAMHQDHDSLVDQRRVVGAYHRRYQQFSELGFVGRESRLDWVETLRTTTAGLELPRVSYAIEPQLAVVPPVQSVLGGGEINIHVSQLQLELGLVHELDLLRFFDALQAQAPGFIKVDSCELAFEGEGAAHRADANISASCTAQIYSVITSDVTAEALL